MTLKSITWRLLYILEGIWLPIHAQFVGIWHLIRRHNIKWFEDPDLWNAHLGWIYCHDCKDTVDHTTNKQPVDLVIWGFYFPRVHRVLQVVCNRLGHKDVKEALACRVIDNDENHDDYDETWDVPTGHFYCSRCLADMPAPDVDNDDSKQDHFLIYGNPDAPKPEGIIEVCQSDIITWYGPAMEDDEPI